MVPGSIAIVIPYYSSEAFLAACLSSIARATPGVSEVVIVDNCPSGVAGLPAGLPFTTTILRTRPGIGFGRACNVGMAYCLSRGFSTAILLNQDTILEERTISELLAALERNPSAFAASPIALSYDGSSILDETIRAYLAPHSAYIRDLVFGTVRPEYDVPFDGLNGACLAVALRHWPTVNGFDPIYQMYGEDRDLLLRATKLGLKLLLVPRARVRHAHSCYSSSGKTRLRIRHQCLLGECIRLVKESRGFSLLPALRIAVWWARHAFRYRTFSGVAPTILRFLSKLPTAIRHRDRAALDRAIEDSIREDRAA